MFCHCKRLCKNFMAREWLTSLGINVGSLGEIGSRFPMVFSEALVWLVAQSRLTLYNLIDCSLPSSSVHGVLQARILERVAVPFSRGSSQATDRTHVSYIADSLLPKPPGKPSKTGVGSLFLLQQIFPTQESNWGLLPCRWILYHLSHQGSTRIFQRGRSHISSRASCSSSLFEGSLQFSSVQGLSRVQLFAACLASLSITNFRSPPKPVSIESVMPSNRLILCCPLKSFPASGSFERSQLFASGGQSIGVSTSVLPVNTQDWSPLGWTGWIFLQSKELS